MDEAGGLRLTDADLAIVRRVLAEHLGSARVRVLGSRVPGWPGVRGPKRHSDLDLAVEGPVSALGLALARQDFEESDLPVRVDLLLWDDLSPRMQELTTRAGWVLQQPKRS